MVSDSDLAARLRQILQSSDLNTATPGTVRRQLENDFGGVDFSGRKRFIGQQIGEFLEAHVIAEEEEGDDEADKVVHKKKRIRSCDAVTARRHIFTHPKDVYTQELGRSAQMDGSPGEIVGANENGIDASHTQSQLIVQGSPMALPAGWDNPRFRKYLDPVRLPVIQHDQSVQGSPKALPAGLDKNPRFREYWVPIRLSSIQLEQYCSTLMINSGLLCSTAKRGNLNILNDVLCNLRKCCDHPYALDPTLSAFSQARSPLVDHLSIDIPASGKLQLLSRFLPRIREQGLRVLIVYKTSSNSGKNCAGVGDILDDFLCQSFGQESYVHLYTSDSVTRKKKQAAIDLFNDKTSGRFVVLTGYKSSLASIRLSSVDAVILFNSDWNPVNDIRALQKMTLHTKKDHLRVFRLYSVCTLEEKALGLAQDGAAVKIANQYISRITCNMLLAWGAAYLFEKLDALHASEDTNSSEYDDFLCNVINELSTILSSNIDDPSISCSVISKVSEVGKVYPGNVKLHGEVEVQSLDDVPPNVFWSSLLDDRSPLWRFLPEEAGVLGRWSRGRSNAKRSKRSRRCTWGEIAVVGERQDTSNLSEFRVTDAASSLPSASFDPLQIELEQIQKAVDEASKKHGDMVVQFAAERDQEIAQIYQKYSLLFRDAKSGLMQKKAELKVCHQKTIAHKLLADAWRLAIQENSPLDIMVLPPSPLANGMQMNASALSRQFANQFSDMTPTDQIVRPYVPNQLLHSAPPAASFPFEGFTLSQMMNQQHPLNCI